MGKEIWIINGERMELDVLEVYTLKDREEVERYRKKSKHKKRRI